MARQSPANLRAFVRRNTTLRPIPDLPGIRLHTADDVTLVWHRAGEELDLVDAPLPFWAFPWAGGLAVARFLLDRPEEVAGRRVLDLAAGSGVCAIAAAIAGAASVHAFDVDPLSAAAVTLNARANDVRVAFSLADLLTGDPPPGFDTILAGDVCYEETMAEQMIAWLRRAAALGNRVLLGDPGRRYLPQGLDLLATYSVRTTRELEEADVKPSRVYAIDPATDRLRRPVRSGPQRREGPFLTRS
jgi:predicted nicotinamide N-methyase